MNQPVVEPEFIEKFELHVDFTWQILIAAARNDRCDEQVIFVDKASTNGMRCERRTADPNIAGRTCLEFQDRIPIERPFEPCLGCGEG